MDGALVAHGDEFSVLRSIMGAGRYHRVTGLDGAGIALRLLVFPPLCVGHLPCHHGFNHRRPRTLHSVLYRAMLALNVLGSDLQACSFDPLTGFFRDGCCRTDDDDLGSHVVCARMTTEFLEFSRDQGNDLITPRPEFRFPGLKAGDRWCVCALRWKEALDAGVAPPVYLEATHARTLDVVSLEVLKAHAVRLKASPD